MTDSPLPTEASVRISTLFRMLRRRRWKIVRLAAIGAAVGAVAAVLIPPTYEATSQVLLQGTYEKNAVATEAQLATSIAVLGRTIARLGWPVEAAKLQDSVSSDTPNGNIIEINAEAKDPVRARDLAKVLTEEYVSFSTELLTRSTDAKKKSLQQRQTSDQQRIRDIELRMGKAQGAERDRLSAERTDLAGEVESLDKQIQEAALDASQSQGKLVVIDSGSTPTAPRPPNAAETVLGAAGLGAVLGALGLVVARLSDRRLRRRSDIAQALGARVIGTVRAPVRDRATGGRRSSRRGKAGGSAAAGEVANGGEESLDQLVYRRALARLPGQAGRFGRSQLLIVVVDDDLPSFQAIAQLARAGRGAGPVHVVTDHHSVAKAVWQVAGTDGDGPDAVIVAEDVASRSGLQRTGATVRVLPVSLRHPVVRTGGGKGNVVAVVSSGAATAWQLLSVAEACADAGCLLSGVLVVVREGDEEEVGHIAASPPEPVKNGHVNGADPILARLAVQRGFGSDV